MELEDHDKHERPFKQREENGNQLVTHDSSSRGQAPMV